MDFKKKVSCKDSITMTIRFSGKIYDEICEIAKINEISFNSVVNQILEKFLNEESGE